MDRMDRIQRLSRMLIAATKKAGGELTLTAEDLDVDGLAIRFDEQDVTPEQSRAARMGMAAGVNPRPQRVTVLKVITHDEAIELGKAQRRLERELGPGPGRDDSGLGRI